MVQGRNPRPGMENCLSQSTLIARKMTIMQTKNEPVHYMYFGVIYLCSFCWKCNKDTQILFEIELSKKECSYELVRTKWLVQYIHELKIVG